MLKKPLIVTIMQTRRSSTRLPDKALLPLVGKPLFIRQAERICAANLIDELVIATTTATIDDEIAGICAAEGYACFRGHEHDLLDRHYQAALLYKADVVIKIPSDCPLIDPMIIDDVIRFYLGNQHHDYVSNLHPATYPDGNDVEIMSFSALERAWKEARKDFEREHTTPFIWEHPHRFSIGNVTIGDDEDYSMQHRWTIDYKEDYQLIKAVYEALYPTSPFFSCYDVLSLLENHPHIYAVNHHLAGVNWYRHHLHELKTIDVTQTKNIAFSSCKENN